MRHAALPLAAGLVLSASSAQAVEFLYTGSIATWTVPATGLYRIVAFGAQGAGLPSPFPPDDPRAGAGGGRGAEVGGRFQLTGGTILNIVVGRRGSYGGCECAGGGGGGSWVYVPQGAGGVPLLVAGGGGGDGFWGDQGGPGQAIRDGQSPGGGHDGSGGAAGGASFGAGGGGGGWLGNGGTGDTFDGGEGIITAHGGGGAFSFAGGVTEVVLCWDAPPAGCVHNDATNGGYGGGGASGWTGGGGGGGYSGGGGGSAVSPFLGGGGGGGSFIADEALAPFARAGVRLYDGLITINQAVPEPSIWVQMLLGFAALGAMLRRSRSPTPVKKALHLRPHPSQRRA